MSRERRRREVPANRRKADENEGVIRDNEGYTLEALKRRLDLSDSAWWALASKGFPQKQIGKRKLILGKDALDFLATLPNVESDAEAPADSPPELAAV